MTDYSEAFRNRMVERLSGPDAISAGALARETGVSQPTLSKWLRGRSTLAGVSKNAKKKTSRPANSPRRSKRWSAEEKFRLVMAAAALDETQLGSFLRKEGLHEEDLARFRQELQVAVSELDAARKPRSGESEEQQRIKQLERELKRKDAALAETAALLVLRKKAVALWGEEGDDT